MNLVDAIKHAQGCFDDPPPHESATCDWIILPLLHAIGYLPREIVPQLKDQNRKLPDHTILPGTQWTWFVEAKAWHIGLEDTQIVQALNYANHNGRRWVVLSNGKLWRLYDNSIQGIAPEKLVAEVSLGDTLEMLGLLTALGKESLKSEGIEAFAKTHLDERRNRERKSKIDTALSDQLSNIDSAIVSSITATLREVLSLPDIDPTDIVRYFNRTDPPITPPPPIDAGFRHRIEGACHQLVETQPGLIVDRKKGSWTTFILESWQDLPKVEAGWSRVGSLVLLWIAVEDNKVKLALEIGPGPQELRQRIYDTAKSLPTLFTIGNRKLSPTYCRVYVHHLVPVTEFESHDFDIAENSLKTKWARFVSVDLPRLEQAVLSALTT